MRRKDREVTDINEIVGILSRCDVIRLGLAGQDGPYVVPLSFGYEFGEGNITVYFHGAVQGQKHELLAADNRVCVEADIFTGYKQNEHGITAGYESVIGFGHAEIVTGAEARRGLELICEHCGYPDYPIDECSIPHTRVYKITLDSVTGKRNII